MNKSLESQNITSACMNMDECGNRDEANAAFRILLTASSNVKKVCYK